MLRIRRFEEEAARLYTERKIGGFLHLYIGQEAVAVGALSVLERQDKIITGYRCHGHYLARGGSAKAGMAELLGRATGCVEGRGGSMHFFDIENNFYGGWGIVGGQVPIAAGLAFAQKYKEERGVTLCFLGDGAINIGPFHEGLSLAALWGLPVVYLIENNEYAMGTPIEKTFPTEDLSIRALGYPMARDTIDGHDIFEVRSKVHTAVQRAREQNQPTLIEVKTYRYRGHSMADPQQYRTKEMVQIHKDRDAIELMGQKLDSLGMGTKRANIENAVEAEIQEAVKFAEESPYPDESTAANYVYV
ncbi:MAG: pyruvate dehydrogenase (acetyl-transferring) E1 component subunit alpha [Bdellovibrionales bacterium]|nr:pyruvate dehydrogenase (acetyl-transferring) E1 component subunit alpha [Bdellovibrionales bacterium]